MQIGCVAKLIDDLEGGGLLTLDAVGVDGVDEGDGMAVGELAGEGEGVVEGAVDGQDSRAMRDGLCELAFGDGAARNQDVDLESLAGGVSRGGGAGVAGGGAEHGFMAGLDGFGDGQDHAAILEGAGGIAGFELEVHGGGAGGALQRGGAEEGGGAFAEGDSWRGVGEGRYWA